MKNIIPEATATVELFEDGKCSSAFSNVKEYRKEKRTTKKGMVLLVN